jgi:hypothetical protein
MLKRMWAWMKAQGQRVRALFVGGSGPREK